MYFKPTFVNSDNCNPELALSCEIFVRAAALVFANLSDASVFQWIEVTYMLLWYYSAHSL